MVLGLHLRPNSRTFVRKLGYKDSNLEMTESESVALPFGDSPSKTSLIIVDLGGFFKPYGHNVWLVYIITTR